MFDDEDQIALGLFANFDHATRHGKNLVEKLSFLQKQYLSTHKQRYSAEEVKKIMYYQQAFLYK